MIFRAETIVSILMGIKKAKPERRRDDANGFASKVGLFADFWSKLHFAPKINLTDRMGGVRRERIPKELVVIRKPYRTRSSIYTQQRQVACRCKLSILVARRRDRTADLGIYE